MSSRIKTYLGVDWGTKRIGLAIGDSSSRLASPFKVVGDMEEVIEVVAYEEIDEVVIGKPLKMHEAVNDLDKEYIEFVEDLTEKLDVPVTKIDERLSSKMADSLEGDKKTKAARDAVAAMIILQAFLDNLGGEKF